MTTPTAKEFYDAVLPTNGPYYIGPKGWKKPTPNRASFDKGLAPALAAKAKKWASDKGLPAKDADIYHATAQFEAASTDRKGERAVALRCFRLDIDTKITHPDVEYADQAAALSALQRFLSTTSLPKPWIIDSGGGLHVYWALLADLPAAEWQLTANLLKIATGKALLACGPEATADSARLLRAIGAVNTKTGTTVTILQAGTPCNHAVFRKLLEVYTETSVGTFEKISSGRKGNGKASVHDPIGAALTAHPPSNPDTIAKKCALMGDFRDGKDQDYDVWTGLLTVLASTGNAEGRDRAHKWSKAQRPNEYDDRETDQKLDSFKGPRTCGKFKEQTQPPNSSYPVSPCDSCRYFHSSLSPIRLGEVDDVPQGAAPPLQPPSQPPSQPQSSPTSAPTSKPSGLPPPPPLHLAAYPKNGLVQIFPPDDRSRSFHWEYSEVPDQQGYPFTGMVYRAPSAKKKAEFTETKFKGAFYVTGIVPDAEFLMQCHYRYVTTKSFALAPDDTHGPELFKVLARYGFQVSGIDKANMVRTFIDRWYYAASRHAEMSGGTVFGLQPNEEFIVGQHVVRKDGSVASAALSGSAANVLANFNTLPDTSPPVLLAKAQEWGQQVDTLFNHRELISHQFMILCSFASMVWALCPADVFGITISASGIGTGLGKTSCVKVAGSVWGNTRYLMSAAGSATALAGRAATLNNLPMIIDEMYRPPREVANMISELSGGTDKTRSNRSATTQVSKTWKLMVLMTSNNRLASSAVGQGAGGVDARLWEVRFSDHDLTDLRTRLHKEWDSGSSTLDPTKFEKGMPNAAITNLCETLGGYAGLQFASEVLPRRAAVAGMVEGLIAVLFDRGVPDTPSNRIAIRAAACVLVALRILNREKRQILHFDYNQLEAWIIAQLEARSITSQSVIYSPLDEFLTAVLQHHGVIQVFESDIASPNQSPQNRTEFDQRSIEAIRYRVKDGTKVISDVIYLPSPKTWFPETYMTVLDALRSAQRLGNGPVNIPTELANGSMPQSYKIDMLSKGVATAVPAGTAHQPTSNVVPISAAHHP